MPPDSVLGYATALADELIRVSDGLVQAAYLHGSAVLGGSGADAGRVLRGLAQAAVSQHPLARDAQSAKLGLATPAAR